MSFQVMTWAVEQELPALQKLVLLTLANCCNSHTGRCDPSHDTLATECGMSRGSVRQAIAEIEKKGLIEIRRQTQNGVKLPDQDVLKVGGIRGGVDADSTDGYRVDGPDGSITMNVPAAVWDFTFVFALIGATAIVCGLMNLP